jgi:hypothetical protein
MCIYSIAFVSQIRHLEPDFYEQSEVASYIKGEI